jgi:quercetin dioxygenase-like cupin family protein
MARLALDRRAPEEVAVLPLLLTACAPELRHTPILQTSGLLTSDQRHISRTNESNDLQENAMQITRNTIETMAGPSEWFTGAVYVDTVAAPSGPSRLQASSVHFTPGARTAWHTHPNGQTIYVTEGVGLAQRRGGPIEVIRPGDRVFFEPGEDHWHGAAPNRFMTHVAMVEVDDEGNNATWGEHVSDEEYGAAPSIDQ